jgi:iron-sulfur cluster repair protein YtfE (RIC family)
LTNHIYKEERVLFPMVARFLPSDLDAHLLRQMEAMTPGRPAGTSPDGHSS